MVEALRTQNRGSGGDDRVTLGDLTLVAVASATQQLAASPHGGSGAPPSGGGASAVHGQKDQSDKSPEAERAEIDALARAVIDEIRQMTAQAHERSGEAWES